MVIVRVKNDENDNILTHLANENMIFDTKIKLCRVLESDIKDSRIANYEEKIEILNTKDIIYKAIFKTNKIGSNGFYKSWTSTKRNVGTINKSPYRRHKSMER
jgi:hypothetical protein